MKKNQPEKERLQSLRYFQIDYGLKENIFDEVTKLASMISGVEFSMIGFIETNMIYVKSCHGLQIDILPREHSLCDQVVATGEIVIIEDLKKYGVCNAELPVLDSKEIQFYAGFPIVDRLGSVIGVLSVMSQQENALNDNQKETLKSLTEHLFHLLEQSKKESDITEVNRQSMEIQKIAKTGGWEMDTITGEVIWSEEVYRIHQVEVGTPINKVEGISFYADHEQEKLNNYVQRCIENAEKFDDEFEFFDANGVKKWVRSIGEPVFDSEGKVQKLVGVFQDVTEIRKVIDQGEKATKDLEKFFEVGLEFLCIASQSGYFLKVNPPFVAAMGYSERELLEIPFFNMIHPRDLSIAMQEMEKFAQGQASANFLVRTIKKNGECLYIEWSSSPDSESGHIYASGRDVTARELERNLKITISKIRENYIHFQNEPRKFFDFILGSILEFSESEYGFIAEINEDENGRYFKSLALTDIAWNKESKDFYEKYAPNGLEFHNLENLFGETIKFGTPVITNRPKEHKAYKGPPSGHPELKSYMGIPLKVNDKLIAMVGIANRRRGYSQQYYDYMIPLFNVLGESINGFQLERDLKKTRELNAFYKFAIDKAAIVAFTDIKGNITYANDLFCEISGYSREELIGSNHRILKSGVIADETFEKMWQTISNGGTWHGEICNKRKDGSFYWMDTVIVPFKNDQGRVEQYMAIRNDISDLKNQQQELDAALVRAQAAAVAKSDFLSTMSHEIRTPLNGIIGMSSLLSDTELNQEQREYLDSIASSGSALLMIINDILDFSKIESGKMEFEKIEFNYNEFVEEILRPFEYEAKKKGVTFSHQVKPIPYLLKGDSARIGQVINNLVSNAIKFTEKGSVTIYSDLIEKEGKAQLEIEIVDTGVGIPEAARDNLFDAFTQADLSVNRKFGGTGLGLSICKRLVELMDGSIVFESEVGKGTSFKVNLLLEKGERIRNMESTFFRKKPVHNSFEPLEGRVLIAEDNMTNQLLISRFLDKLGCRHLAVANGKEALEELSKADYDLILMDCQMPELDGYSATEIIRNSGKTFQEIPIIALTANALKGDEEKCLAVGMNDYLAKPLKLSTLYEKLTSYLDKQDIRGKTMAVENELPSFDEATLLNLKTAIGDEGTSELVSAYLGTLDSSVELIISNLESGDMANASRAAHSLKSSTMSLGGSALGEICKKIEYLDPTNQIAAKKMVDSLKKSAEDFKEELQDFLKAG